MSAARSVMKWAVAAVFAVGLVCWGPLSQAIGAPLGTMKVEEDWELVVNEPNSVTVGPQVSCVISPVSHLDGTYGNLEVNYGSLPDFMEGGLQLQAWSGEEWLSVRDMAGTTLQNDAETITWTTRMWLQGGKLNFKIANGNGTSWGNFGDTIDNIKLSLSSSLLTLDAYDPAVSVANSGVGFGGQRVASLKIKRIRYYGILGNLLSEDTTEREVNH
jgi:hypothetical protein